MVTEDSIIGTDDLILVTGAAGFIGAGVIQNLLDRGYRNLCCFVRPSSDLARLYKVFNRYAKDARPDVLTGNLLSREDCFRATEGVTVIYHLAAGTGIKSFSDAFMNSVVTTRNLLDATLEHKCLRRFVSLSSFAVYTNRNKPRRAILDESCPVEDRPELRAEAYCYAKVKQDELVVSMGGSIRFPLCWPGPAWSMAPASARSPAGWASIRSGFFCTSAGPTPSR